MRQRFEKLAAWLSNRGDKFYASLLLSVFIGFWVGLGLLVALLFKLVTH